MEIRLVARLASAERSSSTREDFWGQLKTREADEKLTPGQGEKKVFQDFPQLLHTRVSSVVEERRRTWRARLSRHLRWPLWSFRQRPLLPQPFTVSVVSVGYGSLEILLSFLARDDFPLNAREVVQLIRMIAPQVLSDVLNTEDLVVSTGDAAGSLQGDGIYSDGDPSTFARRAVYSSVIASIALFLWVYNLAYSAMVGQGAAASEERRALLTQMANLERERGQLTRDALELTKESRTGIVEPTRQLVEVAVRIDSERSQLGKDTLELLREVRATAAEEHRELLDLRKRLATGGGGGGGSVGGSGTGGGGGNPPQGRILMQTSKVTVYSTDVNFGLGDLVKAALDEAKKHGPEQIRQVIQAFGEGVDALRKVVALGSDIVDLIRKIWPPDKPKCGIILDGASGTTEECPRFPEPLLDRRVNFEFASARLDRATEEALRGIVSTVRDSQKVYLIEGHADGVGDAITNRDLSQCRAYAVKAFLEKEGVPGRQLHAHGYGFGYFWLPWVPADGANRRVRVMECSGAGEDRCAAAADPARSTVDCRKFGLN